MPFNRYNDEELFTVRPRFRLLSDLDKDEILKRIQCNINPDNNVAGGRVKNRCFLTIPAKDQHYWSPEMQIEISDKPASEDYVLEKNNDPSKTIIRCVIGPKQTIWTLFIFGYVVSGIILFFGGMFGLVQSTMDAPAPFLWCFPIGAIMIILLYAAAAYGRKVGHEQMLHLIRFLYHSIDDNAVVRK